jgi:DNA modification methylase
MDLKRVCNLWKKHDLEEVYNYSKHLELSEELEKLGKLSSLFMTLPTHSNNEMVWTDINRMNTLNANQANKKKEKHICPLQLDIIERLINRYSMEGDNVFDPFGGLLSTCYIASKLKRKSRAHELNSQYFADGLYHLKALEYELSTPTLFDL